MGRDRGMARMGGLHEHLAGLFVGRVAHLWDAVQLRLFAGQVRGPGDDAQGAALRAAGGFVCHRRPRFADPFRPT